MKLYEVTYSNGMIDIIIAMSLTEAENMAADTCDMLSENDDITYKINEVKG